MIKSLLCSILAMTACHTLAITPSLTQQAIALTHCQKIKDEVATQKKLETPTAPCLTAARLINGRLVVQGVIESLCNSFFVIQFFNNQTEQTVSVDTSRFIGQKTIKTDSTGKKQFEVALPAAPQGTFISATATRTEKKILMETSDFSQQIEIK